VVTQRWLSTCVLVWAAIAILVGCGGGGDSGDGGEPLSPRQYQKAILRTLDHEPRIGGLYYELVVPPVTKEECERKTNALHDEAQQLVDEVSALNPPEEVAQIHARFVDEANQSVDRVGEISDQVAAGQLSCKDMNSLLYEIPSNDRADQAISELEDHG
jgi:hypothetical protein